MSDYDKAIVKKVGFKYTDGDEFAGGVILNNPYFNEMYVRDGEDVTDAMMMCWLYDHEKAFKKYCKNFNTVVQAGGFNGLYAKLLSNVFETVYTFEPDPVNFHCVVMNNQNPNVMKYNAALGNDRSLISLTVPPKTNPGMFSVYKSTMHRNIIPTLRIDDLGLESCDLLMLDVEGYEAQALLGARETLDKFKPVVCLESDNQNIENFLAGFGYTKKEYLRYASDTVYTVGN